MERARRTTTTNGTLRSFWTIVNLATNSHASASGYPFSRPDVECPRRPTLRPSTDRLRGARRPRPAFPSGQPDYHATDTAEETGDHHNPSRFHGVAASWSPRSGAVRGGPGPACRAIAQRPGAALPRREASLARRRHGVVVVESFVGDWAACRSSLVPRLGRFARSKRSA